MNRLLILSVLLLTLLVGNPAFSDDYDTGLYAYLMKQYATALVKLTPLAEQGHVDAQLLLGMMYQKGEGATQDYKTAVKWYTLAAEQGNDLAPYNLGEMYREGQGVSQDYNLAYLWLSISVSNGLEIAKNILHYKTDLLEGAKMKLDLVEKKMTPAQLKTAKRLASECVQKNYKGC